MGCSQAHLRASGGVPRRGRETACRYDFDRALSARLGEKRHVMGEDFTVPDLILGHCLAWAQTIRWPLPEGTITAYFERLQSRPAFAATMAKRSPS